MNTKENLAQKQCEPCEGIGKSLTEEEARKYIKQVNDWKISPNKKSIYRECTFKNFMAAISFINHIADLAEHEGHHPDLHLTNYKSLRIELTTHALNGLSKNDFILAAKINEIC